MIHEFTIKGALNTSEIRVGDRLESLAAMVRNRPLACITDDRVYGLYKERFPTDRVILMGTGEKAKTLDTVAKIYQGLLDLEMDRSGFVLGVGGGIVCDVAGFVASTYMRGLPFGLAPTTLLAQVDAGVGGKTGVNFMGYKNMVGLFSQPDFVLCDPTVLPGLPESEIKSGLGEIVKHAAIKRPDLFDFLMDRAADALALDVDVISRAVHESVAIKAKVVGGDEREAGQRRILNFGHTYGHAVESVTGLAHGQAVSVGMAAAAQLSRQRGYLSRRAEDRLLELMKKLGLPTYVRADPAALGAALARDKKRSDRDIYFVFLRDIGQTRVEPVPISQLIDAMDGLNALTGG